MPAEIDNMSPPKLSPAETLGIDSVADYNSMIWQICETYRVCFH